VRTRTFAIALVALALIAAGALGAELIVGNGNGSGATSGGPWLGVEMESAPTLSGALVAVVIPGGPADQAGVQAGDLITAVDGVPVSDPTGLANAIADKRPGEQVALEVDRSGQSVQIDTLLAREPAGGP
jgi:S1-C subfamily serine protease